MGVYEELIARSPVVRTSQASDDESSKSVTFLVPLGSPGFTLKLVKRERTWLVGTDAGVDVPLEIFYEEGKERRVVYPRR